MPKVQPTWSLNDEADKMVTQLVQRNPDLFSHIETARLGCAMVVGKEPADNQDWDAKISGIQEPEVMFSSKTYVLWFFESTWKKYTKAQRSAMLFRQLTRITPDFDGKLLKEEHTCRLLAKAFGLDYIERQDLPDLTEQKLS